MMRLFLLLITLALFISCSNKEEIIHYEYNGVKITRINKSKRAFFFYGNCDNNDIACKQASVVVDWSFDDSLFGFLVFNQNGTVEIINGGGGDFQKAKGDDKIFLRDYKNTELQKLLSNYKAPRSYNNLFQISDNLELERSRNREFKSKVIATQVFK